MNRLFTLLMLLPLAGCSAHRGTVSMGLGRGFPLLSPASAPQFGVMQCAVVIEKNDERVFQFDGVLEMEPDRTVFLGMTPLGTRGFAVTWDGTETATERLPFYDLPVSPRELLACVQLMFWDEETLVVFLRERGFRLEWEDRLRRLRLGQRVFITLEQGQPNFPHGMVVLEHHGNRYTLRIQSRQFYANP